MNNNYEVAEIVEIGRAQDVILGVNKLIPDEFDGQSNPRRQADVQEDE